MPIPAFDNILNVMPPHLGDPRDPTQLSPYPCTMQELCNQLATTARRKEILEGFLKLRKEFFDLGVQGFQWLDGSFLEDIEIQEGRPPGDIDVVSFAANPADPVALATLIGSRKPELLDHDKVKATYSVDHFLVPLGTAPAGLVNLSRYWYGLFSHRRDRCWKGMLAVKLNDPADDAAANKILGGKP